jgi:hypothetical protein
MRSVRITKCLRCLLPGGLLLQITACLGPDPEFYLTNLVTSSLVGEVISLLFNLVTTGLTTAAAAAAGS